MPEQRLVGFYTLAELLRQQARAPLDVGVARGWRVRVVVGGPSPNMFPDVTVWEDQLVFGFTDAMLRWFVEHSARMLNLTPNAIQVGGMVPTAFPASFRLETGTPLMRVAGEGRVFFDTRRMRPGVGDSFWLRSPLTLDSLAVELVPMGGDLVATVPQELIDEMLAACKRVLAPMKL